ncbi:nitric oxide dioxygenase [Terribacillus halophilus]|uniref:Flavohemoprotein n=2 Tax=Terribacillus halophilus TaxID=361279 RepID=A0A1G6QSN9_9BACI|nr:NO-inducible flavohemoprotein [Terribacillus halophilus]SDC95370.1 nitric oxide dioxygenase [Terribacillus halophilus]
MLSQETINVIKSTVPVLEEHGTQITTVFYEELFKAHPELLNIFNHANQARGKQQTALANAVYAAAVHIDKLEAILPTVVQIAHKHVSLGVKPEHYPVVGEYLLKAIKMVLGDAATPEILKAWEEAYGVIADAFIGVEANMYEENEKKEGGWAFFKDFTVANKVPESDVITSFYLKPADGEHVPDFQPGQYISVRVSIPGEKYMMIRQYSLSKTPSPDMFRISVKKENDNDPDGKVSVYLHEQVKEGDKLEVSAPAGDFTLEGDPDNAITFIAGGVGITPIMSMLETLAEKDPNREVVFLQAARTPAYAAFTEQIHSFQERMPKLTYQTYYEGNRIDETVLKENVNSTSDVYVCGPAGFMEFVITTLYHAGFSKEQIHFEFFGPAADLSKAE